MSVDEPLGIIELGNKKTCFIHLTLVPYISAAGELKTKPTQHSVKELQSVGIRPDVVLCRTEHSIPDEQREKITERTALKKWGVPEDIAGAAVYLASDRASYTTGTTITVDGGYSIT